MGQNVPEGQKEPRNNEVNTQLWSAVWKINSMRKDKTMGIFSYVEKVDMY